MTQSGPTGIFNSFINKLHPNVWCGAVAVSPARTSLCGARNVSPAPNGGT